MAALSDTDWRDLLLHFRDRVREVGLEDVDDRITRDFQSFGSARTDFRRYFESVLSVLDERSMSTYRRALQLLRESVHLQNGSELDGIEIVVADSDSAIYGAHRVDLGEGLNREFAFQKLKDLMNEMIAAELFREES